MIRTLMPFAVALFALTGARLAAAQVFDSGSTGVLGALTPTANTTVILPEDGVLHYTTVSIPASVTVTFKRNAANTPVYLLASGDITIAGTVDVGGKAGASYSRWWVTVLGGLGGPGGADGASSRTGAGTTWGQSGLGPGGGVISNGTYPAGSAASPVSSGANSPWGGNGSTSYANADWWMYYGGSGGGSTPGLAGGGGGGVVTIASSGTITLTGAVRSNGGDASSSYAHPGAGGIVRLAATTITGTGAITALSGGVSVMGSGAGQIRVDAYTLTGSLTSNCNPPARYGFPDLAVPYPATKRPTLRLVSYEGNAFAFGDSGAHVLANPPNVIPQNATVGVLVEATNVPPGTVVKVAVNAIGATRTVYTGTLAGSLALSTATVNVAVPAGVQAGALEAWLPSIPLPK